MFIESYQTIVTRSVTWKNVKQRFATKNHGFHGLLLSHLFFFEKVFYFLLFFLQAIILTNAL